MEKRIPKKKGRRKKRLRRMRMDGMVNASIITDQNKTKQKKEKKNKQIKRTTNERTTMKGSDSRGGERQTGRRRRKKKQQQCWVIFAMMLLVIGASAASSASPCMEALPRALRLSKEERQSFCNSNSNSNINSNRRGGAASWKGGVACLTASAKARGLIARLGKRLLIDLCAHAHAGTEDALARKRCPAGSADRDRDALHGIEKRGQYARARPRPTKAQNH